MVRGRKFVSMTDERIKALIILYDDSIRYQKKLLDCQFAEELFSIIPICTKNQTMLEKLIVEKTNECREFEIRLETAKDNIAKLYTKHKEDTRMMGFFDDSDEETDTASVFKDIDFLHQYDNYDISSDDYFTAEFINDDKHEHLRTIQEFHDGDPLEIDSKSTIKGIQIVDVKTVDTNPAQLISLEPSITNEESTSLQDSNDCMEHLKPPKNKPASIMITSDQQNQKKFSICDMNYNTRSRNKSSLTVETLKEKNEREVVYRVDKVKNERCEICGRWYSSKSSLNKHIRKKHVTEKKPHECATCGKQFNHKGNFKLHTLIHSSSKLFSCSICGKGFKNQASKFQHQRVVHTEERFECGDCGKRCSRKQNLITHIRMKHSLEKQFQCNYCDKSFVLKTSLKTHELVHMPDRPLKCDICDKRFKYRNSKTFHERKVHKKDVLCFPCTDCSAEFCNEKNLRRHRQNKHAGIISKE